MLLWREISTHRYLLYQLTAREILVRYKQSFLGVGWALLQPLALMLIFTVIFTQFIPLETGAYPYAIHLFSGLLIWHFLARSLTLLTDALVGNAVLIQRVYFPRQLLLVAGLLTRLVDFCIAFLIYVGLMVYYQVPLTPHFLWAAPALFLAALLALSVSFFSSALQVARHDTKSVVELLLQVWFYATPVVYPLEAVPPDWRWAILLNPMTGIVETFRSGVLRGEVPDLSLLGIAACWTAVLFFLGDAFFRQAEGEFADVI